MKLLILSLSVNDFILKVESWQQDFFLVSLKLIIHVVLYNSSIHGQYEQE